MRHRRILDEIANIDLNAAAAAEQIRKKLLELGKVGVILTTLHAGKRIIRARPSEEKPFKNVSELSYKPQQYNKTFQRASTLQRTMFYGSIVPEIASINEPQTARITTLFELSEFVRNQETVGEEDITFSVWEVKDDIELISLVHHKSFERPPKLLVELQKKFEAFAESYPEQAGPTKEVSEFLGNEFAKTPIKSHYDYMISAIYSDIVSSRFDGILYPSVRLAGEGINIAVKPETIEAKISFIGASECTVYKNGKSVLLGNNTQSSLGNEGNLKFEKIADEYFLSKEEGRKQVGLK